nr:PREDICTED: multiple epidermal growth factor-like domains protein 8 [Latimeria chalumnae]|eukprot:XP_006014434.1 PREDICTED: multiple epidermal growth factor-like domains protein 8 [Latimeria chalumnae]
MALHWNGSLLLFGGKLGSGLLANDVWLYNPLDNRWRELARTSSQQPPGLANHAAALVDGWLYVFGGHTQDDSFSSETYQFYLKTGVWQLVIPSGGKPPAAAGLSMVYHAASCSLIVYGGHHPSTASICLTTVLSTARRGPASRTPNIRGVQTFARVTKRTVT